MAFPGSAQSQIAVEAIFTTNTFLGNAAGIPAGTPQTLSFDPGAGTTLVVGVCGEGLSAGLNMTFGSAPLILAAIATDTTGTETAALFFLHGVTAGTQVLTLDNPNSVFNAPGFFVASLSGVDPRFAPTTNTVGDGMNLFGPQTSMLVGQVPGSFAISAFTDQNNGPSEIDATGNLVALPESPIGTLEVQAFGATTGNPPTAQGAIGANAIGSAEGSVAAGLIPADGTHSVTFSDGDQRVGNSATMGTFQARSVIATAVFLPLSFPFGMGCGTPEPEILIDGNPVTGGALAVGLENGSPSSLATCVIGINSTPIDLGLIGFPGCTLLASPDIPLAAMTDMNGSATLNISIGSAPPMGSSFFFQWIIIDLGSLSLSASNGATLTF